MTPLANTVASGRVPFMAVHPTAIEWSGIDSRDEVVGPVLARVNGRFSGDEAVELRATRGALLRLLAHLGPLFFGWLARGDARRSPFFDPKTRDPIREPRLFDRGAAPDA